MSDRIQAIATHHFSTPAEQVYDAWLSPEAVRSWMSNALQSHGLTGEIKRVEIEPTVGGLFYFSDLRNGTEVTHRGTYRTLDRPEKIAFTWIVGNEDDPDPSVVTIAITVNEKGCDATITHEMDAKWRDYIDRTASGWVRMMEHIDEYLTCRNSEKMSSNSL